MGPPGPPELIASRHGIPQLSAGMVKTEAMDTTHTAVERGSDNVFADLGLPDAAAHLAKAELVSRIDDILRERGISPAEAVRLLGLSGPNVSRLLRGEFRDYSLEDLLRLLTALG